MEASLGRMYICSRIPPNQKYNDIKSDNVLIEGVQGGSGVRGVLIDFNKACSVDSGKVYRLSPEEQKYYAQHHPQVAPEVRRGVCKQSFASDIFGFGRVLQKVNTIVLKLPYLYTLSGLCLKENHSIRPTAIDLHTSLSNLFNLA